MRVLCLFFLSVLQVSAAEWSVLSDASLSAHDKMDGDSIPVSVNGTNFIYNLYFIDAPETWGGSAKAKEQAVHWEQDAEGVVALAKKIGPAIGEWLGSGFEIHTLGHAISKAENRYYGMVKVGDRFLSELLVESGLARPKGKTATLPDGTTALDYMNRLRALEDEAKTEKRGLWADNPAEQSVAFAAPDLPTPPDPEPVAEAETVEGAKGTYRAGQIITLDAALPVYRMDKKLRPAGSLAPGRRIQVLDPRPLIRVQVEIPGKPPVEVLIHPDELPVHDTAAPLEPDPE